jgi:hypothetical protein
MRVLNAMKGRASRTRFTTIDRNDGRGANIVKQTLFLTTAPVLLFIILTQSAFGRPLPKPYQSDKGSSVTHAGANGGAGANLSYTFPEIYFSSVDTLAIIWSSPDATPPRAVPLGSMPYVEIGDSDGYAVNQRGSTSSVNVFSRERVTLCDGRSGYRNHVTFALDGKASSFSATLEQPKYPAFDPELTYRFLGDGDMLLEAVLRGDSSPLDIELDTIGVTLLTIVAELTGRVPTSFSVPHHHGLIDPIVVTTDY